MSAVKELWDRQRLIDDLQPLLEDPQTRKNAAYLLYLLDPVGMHAAKIEIICNPGAIESFGHPVPEDRELKSGDYVEVEYQGSWWSGSVVKVFPDGKVLAHYQGWGASSDEKVPRTRLRSVSWSPRSSLRSGPVPPRTTPCSGRLL